MRRLYFPSPRATNILLTVGFLSIGYALYLRYLVIEQSTVGLACEAGLQTWLCATRRVVLTLFRHDVFGWSALAAASLNLVRPSTMLFAITLMTGGFGIVLYNVGLSSLAAALLLLSLARPVAESE